MDVVHGSVASGFENVATEFERNFVGRGELGAAVAAVRHGELIVDLWGGRAAKGRNERQWTSETLQLIFSGTKGLVATCLLVLIDRDLLTLDDRVADHWPEFAANCKGDITVGEVVSHRARLPVVRAVIAESELTDDRRLASLLADQPAESDPRAAAAYHGLTYGWLCGELIRRVDGRSVGRFFADEVAGPLGLELWIGLPIEEEHRVSELVYGASWPAESRYSDEQLRADSLLTAYELNPPVLKYGRMPWNTRAFHAAEIPAVNAIGTARATARLYACLACGGAINDVRLLNASTIELGRRELSRFTDELAGLPFVYGAGFQLQTDYRQLGPPPAAFGHPGAGGSVHVAWPSESIGVSYLMNEMRHSGPEGDPRAMSVLHALFDCLGSSRTFDAGRASRSKGQDPTARQVDGTPDRTS